MARQQLRDLRSAAAYMTYELEHMAWRRLEKALTDVGGQGTVTPLAYVDYSTYDGVDLRLITKAFSRQVQRKMPALEDGSAGPASDAIIPKLAEEIAKHKPAERAYGLAKIQNTENRVGLVVEHNGCMEFIIGNYFLSALVRPHQ